MRLQPLLMQLLMGMSIRRYLPAIGTAGLLRSMVKGKSREPRPPPRMRLSTSCCMVGTQLGEWLVVIGKWLDPSLLLTTNHSTTHHCRHPTPWRNPTQPANVKPFHSGGLGRSPV